MLGEAIVVFPDWFQLLFIENKGAAFGMHIPSAGGFDWGKLLLGIFRIAMVSVIGWLLWRGTRKREVPTGILIGGALIFAGALGNILDSAFYGLLFSESTPYTVARFGGHYAGFMMGKVVRYVLFPALPLEQRPRVASLPARQPQLFLRSGFQPRRRIHLCCSGLPAYFPAQVFQPIKSDEIFRPKFW